MSTPLRPLIRSLTGSLLPLGALLAVWSSMALFPSSADAETPLSISLEAPAVCETDVGSDQPIETIDIPWRVEGGTPPYQVLINGEALSGERGAVAVACGKRRQSEVVSGITTIQAEVKDARGRRAAALHDLQGVRVVRQQESGDLWLTEGETARIHGLLITAPAGASVEVGRYRSADCAVRDESCGDSFRLTLRPHRGPFDYPGSIWIRRWGGAELSRWLSGANKTTDMLIEADGEDLELPTHFQPTSARLDALVASASQPPRPRPSVRSAGTVSGRMSLTIAAPAICEADDRGQVDVAWTVRGGRAPYEVTIAGERYLGPRGIAKLDCGLAYEQWLDSGRRRIQATAVDARGDTATARADMYVLQPYRRSYESQTAGETYKYGKWIATIPPGVEATAETTREDRCPEPTAELEPGWCETALFVSLRAGGHSVSATFGWVSGREYERRAPDDAGSWLAAKLDEFAYSIGREPRLPADFVDASAPLRIHAFGQPPACEPYGRARIAWRATGGRWWPLSASLDGEDVAFSPAEVYCGEEEGRQTLVLRVREGGPQPATADRSVSIEVGYRPYRLLADLTAPGECVPGETVEATWYARRYGDYEEQREPDSTQSLDSGVRVTINGSDGGSGEAGSRTFRCPDPPDLLAITMRTTVDDQTRVETRVVYPITERPPRFEP